MCKHKQEDAAKLLGVGQQELRIYELGISVAVVPCWLIKTASEVYDVSCDWLMGLQDDWEVDLEIRKQRDFLGVLERLHIQAKSEVIAKQIRLESALNDLSDAVSNLTPAIIEIDEGFMRFWELNPEFEDMRCGASIINKIDSANKFANEAVRRLVRINVLPIENLSSIGVSRNAHEAIN